MASKVKKFIIFLIFSANLFSNEEIFEKGVDLYKEKKYQEALNQWLELEKNFEDWRIYYNIGNAYVKLGRTGYGMLYYERALKLKPGEKRIEDNINFLKLRLKDKIEEPTKSPLRKAIENFYNKLNFKRILYPFFISFLLLNLILFFYQLYPERFPRIFLIFSSFLITLFFILLIFLFHFQYKEKNIYYGIILNDSLEVKSAPMEDSTDLFIIHEGLKVKVNEEVEGWVRITLSNGMSGFVKKESLGII